VLCCPVGRGGRGTLTKVWGFFNVGALLIEFLGGCGCFGGFVLVLLSFIGFFFSPVVQTYHNLN